MEFSRQEYWSGLPSLSSGDLPNPGTEPGSPALQATALPSEPPEPMSWWGKHHSKLSLIGTYGSLQMKRKWSCVIVLRNTFSFAFLIFKTLKNNWSVLSFGEGNGNPLQHSCVENLVWIKEPSGLQFMGLKRVGRNLVTEHAHASFTMKIFVESIPSNFMKSIVFWRQGSWRQSGQPRCKTWIVPTNSWFKNHNYRLGFHNVIK